MQVTPRALASDGLGCIHKYPALPPVWARRQYHRFHHFFFCITTLRYIVTDEPVRRQFALDRHQQG